LETSKGGLLKQRKLFEYAIPKKGRSHDCGLTKSVSDFEHSPAHSTLWGDKLSASKRKVDGDVFRTYSHNPNGLSCSDDNLDVLNFARAIHDKDVALVSLYEVNRNFGRQDVLKSFHHHLRGVSTHHQGAVSSARLPWRTKYQPGGTAVSVRNKWATRYLDKGSDSLGRWSWLTLTGKGTTRVTFISAYRVCDGAAESSVTSGTVRSQQEYLYASWGHSSINLREQFVTDISALIIELQDKGHTIQLSMDANEASGPGSGVDRIMSNCNLVDAHSIRTSDSSPVPATYQRGSKKIDFVLLSPRLVEAVVGVSILALYDGYLSDHRALIVDFDALLLFGGPTSSIIAPMERRLTSTNPRAIHAYTTHMRSHFATHRIVEKVAALSAKSAKDQWGPAEILEWEKIDDQLDKARRAAEQKCASKQSSKYPWSPELDRAGSGVLYWQLRMREFINPETNLDSLETLAVKANIPESSQTRQTSEFVQQALRQARRDLKQVQKDSVTLREQHAAETAKFYATVHNMDTAKAARAIASRELSSKRFRELRSVMKPGRSNGLDYLDVPNADAVLREGEEVPRIPLVTKEEMEEALLPHTEKRFRQYQETPFGADVRRKRLGLDCTSADVQALLNSSYDHDLDGLTVEAQTWLKQLQKKPFAAKPDGLISTVIEVDEWIAGWSKMRESTASAPGGHYGHYKTAAVIAKLDEKHEDYFPDLAETYAIMTSFPLKWGFAPKRWCSCIDAILEKIPGRPIIEKLRIIMLYEADFNFVLKLIWGKRLVRHAESNLALGSDNHGSRPGRKCTDALLEKLLIYENARLTRTSLITVDNDAKSCYDRIIKTLAMTACMAVGLPLAAAMMHNLTHHSMKHRIKSRHGLFRAYFGTDDDALEGSGQGSGGSPGIWLIYSVSLLAAFCNFSPGMKLLSPYDTLLMVSILAVFFVDDGMLGRNDATDEFPCPLPDLIVAAEESAQSWERLLFASGGALELSKCFAYIVYWDLSPSKEPRMLEPQEISGCTPEGDHFRGPIGLKYGDVSTVRHLIVTESPHRGRRTLGARIAPSGNWDDEFNFRRKQGHELSLRLAGSSLAKETARLGYRTMVCPALEYPLTVTQFTQERCDKISSPILRSSLSQMGYNRNSPKEVVYGPEEMGGLGLHDLFIEQGIAQVTALVGHLREKKSKTGDMMKIELDWCQLQAGTADHLLENPFTAIDYIESCWIMSIRDFLRMYKVRMEFTEHSHPVALCEGDEFIMDALRVRGQCSARDMQRLNACRMHLRVSRLSEIATAQGTKIRADVLKGNTEGIHLSEARWPRQAKPLAADWTFWSNKLRAVFSIDGGSPSLRTHLGPWKPTLDFREWNTLVSVDTVPREVFRRLPDGNYEVFEEAAGRNSTRFLWVSSTTSKVTDTLPFDVVPAEMQVTTKKVKQSKVLHRGQTFTPPSRAEATSFSEYVAQQPPHVQRLLRHCDLTEITTRKLVTLISSPRPFDGGTDGGLLNEFGTFGYVWGNSFAVDKLLPVGKGHVPGASFIMSSTRAELCGLFAAITHLRLVVEYHAIIPNKNASCRIYCDSKAALARVADKYYNGFGTTWRCRTNYDLEVAIRNCLLELPIPIKWHWVKGHASSRKRPDELTFPELLNETADELATAARQSQALMQLDDAHWPEQTVSVIGPRGRMCGRLASELRFCCTAPDLLSYWRARFQWSKAQVALVDLPGTKQALAKLSSDAKQRVQKLRCGWLPVNRRVSREDPDRLNGCSACLPRNMVEETVDHLFQCPCRSRRLAMQDRLAGMFKAFREWKTSTALIKALHSGAWAWIEGREIPDVEGLNLPNSPMGKLIHKAYVDQTSLGWNLLFRGFWAISWRQAQDYEFSQSPFHRGHQDNGVSWASRAQGWFFDLFDLVWGLRNADEHGGDLETQRLIRLAKCERAIRRLYRAGKLLPFHEQHQFRDEIEDVLSKSLSRQERWITLTEDFLPGAAQRVRDREQRGQNSLMAYDGWSRTPRIHE
jgi:ribonuclease HI